MSGSGSAEEQARSGGSGGEWEGVTVNFSLLPTNDRPPDSAPPFPPNSSSSELEPPSSCSSCCSSPPLAGAFPLPALPDRLPRALARLSCSGVKGGWLRVTAGGRRLCRVQLLRHLKRHFLVHLGLPLRLLLDHQGLLGRH